MTTRQCSLWLRFLGSSSHRMAVSFLNQEVQFAAIADKQKFEKELVSWVRLSSWRRSLSFRCRFIFTLATALFVPIYRAKFCTRRLTRRMLPVKKNTSEVSKGIRTACKLVGSWSGRGFSFWTWTGTIIATWREKGCGTTWKLLKTFPLQTNPNVCWKTCYLVHKVLREGHTDVS